MRAYKLKAMRSISHGTESEYWVWVVIADTSFVAIELARQSWEGANPGKEPPAIEVAGVQDFEGSMIVATECTII